MPNRSRTVMYALAIGLVIASAHAAEKAPAGIEAKSVGIWLSIMENVDDTKLTANAKTTDGDLTVMKGNFRVDKTNWRNFGHVKAPLMALDSGQSAQLSMTGKPFVAGTEPKDLSIQITPKLVADGYSLDLVATRVSGADRRTGKATVIVHAGDNVAVTLNEDAAGAKKTLIYIVAFDGADAKLKMKGKAAEADIAAGTIERFDFNGDGVVSKAEASQAAEEMTERMVNRGLNGTWKSFDADGDGIVSETERKALKAELEKRLTDSVKVATKDDGKEKPETVEAGKDVAAPKVLAFKLTRIDKDVIAQKWAAMKKKEGALDKIDKMQKKLLKEIDENRMDKQEWWDKKNRKEDWDRKKGDWGNKKGWKDMMKGDKETDLDELDKMFKKGKGGEELDKVLKDFYRRDNELTNRLKKGLVKEGEEKK